MKLCARTEKEAHTTDNRDHNRLARATSLVACDEGTNATEFALCLHVLLLLGAGLTRRVGAGRPRAKAPPLPSSALVRPPQLEAEEQEEEPDDVSVSW